MDSETGETQDLLDSKKPSRKSCTTSPKFVYILTIFAALGGFQFGYDTGVVSGSMLLISEYYDLSTLWIEAIVSGTVATSVIFSILGGYLSDYTGRRKTIMTGSLIFTIGAIVMTAAPSKEILLVGRLVLGVAVGFTSVTVPVYVAEVAPPDVRGSLGTVNVLFITVGILVSSIVAGSFSHSRDTGWRYMLGMGALPGIFQFVGFIFLPESPRWLMNHGLEHKARDVIFQIHGASGLEEEVTLLRETLQESKISSREKPGSTLLRVWKTPHVRRALFVGGGLHLFSQLCGVNTVMYYSAMIMQMAGFSVSKSIWLSVVPTALQLVAAGVGVSLMDRLGRRIILLLSLAGLFLSLSILAASFQLAHFDSPRINRIEITNHLPVLDECSHYNYSTCKDCTSNSKCGFCYDAIDDGLCLSVNKDDTSRSLVGPCNSTDQSNYTFSQSYCPDKFAWMLVLGMVLFMMSYAPGLGPIPWLVNSEIYPVWARGVCSALTSALSWLLSLVVSSTFLTLTHILSTYGTFWVFAGMCVLGFLFVLLLLPETKGRTLEEVEELFMSPPHREEQVRLRKEDSYRLLYNSDHIR